MANKAIPMDVKKEGLTRVSAAEGTAPMSLGFGGYVTVAVKDFYWAGAKKFITEEIETFQNEVTLMLYVSGRPNVAGTLGWFIESRVDSCRTWTYRGCIVIELASESLFSFVQRNGPTIDLANLGVLLCGMLEGMKTLKECKIVHNDLKPQNVLVLNHGGDNLCSMISDFGVSQAVQSPDDVLPD
eukprot:gene12295-15451_t